MSNWGGGYHLCGGGRGRGAGAARKPEMLRLGFHLTLGRSPVAWELLGPVGADLTQRGPFLWGLDLLRD